MERMAVMGKYFNEGRMVKREGAMYCIGKAKSVEEAAEIVESFNNPTVETILNHDYNAAACEDIITLKEEKSMISYVKYGDSKSGTGYHIFLGEEKMGYVSKFQDGTWMAYNGRYGLDSSSQKTRKAAAEELIRNIQDEREAMELMKKEDQEKKLETFHADDNGDYDEDDLDPDELAESVKELKLDLQHFAKGEKKKMGKVKKFFIGSAVTIGLIGMIGACGDSETTTTTTTPAKTEQKQEVKKSAKQYNIGDSIKTGDVVFTVTKKEVAGSVGGEYGEKASGKYLILDATVKNEGKEAISIGSSFFTIKSGGSKFSADDDAALYVDDAFIYEDINPGVEFKGKIIFDIPEEVANSDENILTVQDSILWAEEGNINLK